MKSNILWKISCEIFETLFLVLAAFIIFGTRGGSPISMQSAITICAIAIYASLILMAAKGTRPEANNLGLVEADELMEKQQEAPGDCIICGERLHMGCCNPSRPAGAPPGQPSDHLPPMALTDSHVRALERAIRAEGYNVLRDISTGAIALQRANIPADDPWDHAGTIKKNP